MLFRQIGVFAGIFILVLVILAGISLATWNIADPSLSYATDDNTVTNMLGFWGAVYADLTMQFFGLSSVIALLSPFLWATSLIFQHEIPSFLRCFFFWILSITLFSISAFMLPVFQKWPMPTGPGGILGDKLISFSNPFFVIFPSYITEAVIGFLLAPLSLILAISSSGITNRHHGASKGCRALNDTRKEDSGDYTWSNKPIIIFGWLIHIWTRFSSLFHIHDRKKNNDINMFFLIKTDDGREANFHVKDVPHANEVALKHRKFEFPHINYLSVEKTNQRDKNILKKALKENARMLTAILKDFDVSGKIINVYIGPVVTLYELELAKDAKSARIVSLSDNIARSMNVLSIRVEIMMERRSAIRIELPNSTREIVYLREILESQKFRESKAKLCLILGKDVRGRVVITDLAKMPHVLIAGAMGSGKSVTIHTMILSLVYRMTPEECRFIMIDPKMLELSVYDGIPHLLTPIVTDPKKALIALKWAVHEMEYRYHKMAQIGAHNIDCFNHRIREASLHGENFSRMMETNFNKKIAKPMFEKKQYESTPVFYIVIIITEIANLMMACKDIEAILQQLARMARAVGIHIIMATQHPSINVITSVIKENFPTRIALAVSSTIDSNTILGDQGAEQLLGQGDMLFMTESGRIQRIHGAFVNDSEVNRIVAHLKIHGIPNYLSSITEAIANDNAEHRRQ